MTPSAPPCVVSTELDPIILPAIQRLAARLSHGDEALAEDLAQEARLAAWQAGSTWWAEGGVELRPWVMTAARYAMFQALRRRLGLLVEALPEDWEQGDDGASAEQLERAIELRQRLATMRPRERASAELVLAGQRLRERRSELRLRAAVRRIAG